MISIERYTEIVNFNKMAGNKPGDPAAIEKQNNLISEEFYELDNAIKLGDKLEIRKEACDVIVVLAGMAYIDKYDTRRFFKSTALKYAAQCIERAGGNVEADLKAVNKSNLSKFCVNDNELNETLLMYQQKNISVIVKSEDSESFAVTSAKDQTDKHGRFYPLGKLLKPAHYIEAVLQEAALPEAKKEPS